MKIYKRIMAEDIATNVPVVSIEKNQVDLDDEDTLNEINRNLSIILSRDFTSVGEGLTVAKKLLSMYGVELPYFEIKNNKKGVLTTPISQYRSSGESHFRITPPFYEKNFKNKFTYKYELKDGKYDVRAEVSRL